MPNRPVGEIMRKQRVVKATERTTVGEAARLMKAAGVGAILVLRKDHLVGIFTERDVLTRVVAEGRDPAHTPLADVMTPNPQSLSPDKPFGHALILMREHGYRHVPVVDHGRAVGVVSMRDALPPELDELEHDVADREHIAEILG
jgi:CBS domain-containing protein